MPVYAKSRSYRVYEEHLSGSFRIVELASLRRARHLVRSSEVREAVELDGETPCFVRVKVAGGSSRVLGRCAVSSREPVVERSSTAFTLPEVDALAGVNFRHGRSRTANLTDEQRLARVDKRGRQLPIEDVVERAANKKLEWGKMGPGLQELVREVNVRIC